MGAPAFIRLIDKPKVDDDEIAGALMWFIKGLADFEPSGIA
ncbi:MAG: hypothetical protein NZ808_02040 [Myxococcota bacterium]|nr:hypothetical protein [Myxococcota bacterium]